MLIYERTSKDRKKERKKVPVCVFFELYNLFDTVTFQTAYICRLTDNHICETKDLLSFDRNSVLLCVS